MNANQSSAGEQMFLVLDVSGAGGADKFSPHNNFIGAQLLARLLDEKLEQAGQLITPAAYAGPLNHSQFVFNVRDAVEAARVVAAALKPFRVFSGAQLYRFAKDELIFRNLLLPGKDLLAADLEQKAMTIKKLTDAAQMLSVLEALSAALEAAAAKKSGEQHK
jgi:hypothetical protein